MVRSNVVSVTLALNETSQSERHAMARYGHSCTKMRTMLYVFGGISDGLPTNEVHCYEMQRCKWYTVKPKVLSLSAGGGSGSRRHQQAMNLKQKMLNDIASKNLSDEGAPGERLWHRAVAVPQQNSILFFGGYDSRPEKKLFYDDLFELHIQERVQQTSSGSNNSTSSNSNSGNNSSNATQNNSSLYSASTDCTVSSPRSTSTPRSSTGSTASGSGAQPAPFAPSSDNLYWEVIKAPYPRPAGRHRHSWIKLEDSAICYLFGGSTKNENYTNDFYTYDISKQSWQSINAVNKPPGRHSHAASIYNDKLFIFGGIGKQRASLFDIFAFDINLNSWSQVNYVDGLSFPLLETPTGILKGRYMFFFFGSMDTALQSVHVFDMEETRWCPVQFNSSAQLNPRIHHACENFDDTSTICTVGGYNDVYKEVNSLSVFEVSVISWDEELRRLQVAMEDLNIDGVNGIGEVLDNEELSDMTLEVEGKEIYVHRAVLCSCSEYFDDMAVNGLLEMQANHVLLDVTYEVVMHVLTYLYNGVLLPATHDVLCAALLMLEKYRIEEPKSAYVDYLESTVNEFNVVIILAEAHKNGWAKIRDFCVDFVKFHAEEVKIVADSSVEIDSLPQSVQQLFY